MHQLQQLQLSELWCVVNSELTKQSMVSQDLLCRCLECLFKGPDIFSFSDISKELTEEPHCYRHDGSKSKICVAPWLSLRYVNNNHFEALILVTTWMKMLQSKMQIQCPQIMTHTIISPNYRKTKIIKTFCGYLKNTIFGRKNGC